jgi:hypothetical protein
VRDVLDMQLREEHVCDEQNNNSNNDSSSHTLNNQTTLCCLSLTRTHTHTHSRILIHTHIHTFPLDTYPIQFFCLSHTVQIKHLVSFIIVNTPLHYFSSPSNTLRPIFSIIAFPVRPVSDLFQILVMAYIHTTKLFTPTSPPFPPPMFY